jgi:hypothetical protein
MRWANLKIKEGLAYLSSDLIYRYDLNLTDKVVPVPGTVMCINSIDISKYRMLFGFFLLYTGTDRVPFELLDSAALQ